MKFERVLSRGKESWDHVASMVTWRVGDALIKDERTGEVIFQQTAVEVPEQWSQRALNILAQKYFRKAGVPPEHSMAQVIDSGTADMPHLLRRSRPATNADLSGGETSARQVFNRIAGALTYHAWLAGVFRAEAERAEDQAQIFYDEVYLSMALQVAAPNSPQWFNTGLFWAYGIEGPDNGMWRVPEEDLRLSESERNVGDTRYGATIEDAVRTSNSYQYPQPHACFLTPTADALVAEGGIMDTWSKEAKIFKFGSGSGINVSQWRGKGEKLSGGGVASGVMSWLRIGDSAAGAIQSGGTTRRAAKMVCMDDDHPELMEFINWKVREEHKAASMHVGSRIIEMYQRGELSRGFEDLIPSQVKERVREGVPAPVLGIGWEEEANRTIDGQNSNNSVRVSDSFMRAVNADEDHWGLLARTTGEEVKDYPAGVIWRELCTAAWASADPGLLFNDTINAWHTCAADGRIRSCNPCAEYHFLDDTACNLASSRLTYFLRDGRLDVSQMVHIFRLWTVVLDVSISMASFPSPGFAVGAFNYRTLGLGYSDLGGLLMRMGLPYGSPEGRALAAGITSLMTGVAYRTSAEMAAEMGAFPRWEANKDDMRRVLRNHARASAFLGDAFEGLNVEPVCLDTSYVSDDLYQAICDSWEAVGRAEFFRNAQVSLIAPTGTISYVMDCDTTGMEPEFALVKLKHLAGGGSMMIINPSVEEVLARLEYSQIDAEAICQFLAKNGRLPTRDDPDRQLLAPFVLSEHSGIFACGNDIPYGDHIQMLAAVAPHLSGAASKTISLPNSATVDDVSEAYHMCHLLGVKAVALYRDKSKLSQPLNEVRVDDVAEMTMRVSSSTGQLTRDGLLLGKVPAGSNSLQVLDEVVRKMGFRPQAFEGTSPHEVSNVGLQRGEREDLPDKAKGYRQKVHIGDLTVFLHTGEYPDGRLGEIFLELAHEGSTMRALANCVAIAVSIGLQHGVPLAKYVEQFLHAKFEPAGMVTGHTDVKLAQSVMDLVARDLAINYLGRSDLSQTVHAVAIDDPTKVVALDKRAVAVAGGKVTGDGCPSCGNLMVLAGTCLTCTVCAWSQGCG